ncbi:MAG: DUF559 domain-containing protein [Desulfovermiculus sp.]|nr:DUF559 domain-containing protein [Desulfovermiculus sp.]
MPSSIYNRPDLKKQLRTLRKEMKPAEAWLWSMLKGKKLDGRKFRRQQSLGPYIVDFYCPAESLVIELDGEVHNDSMRQEYDAERQEFLHVSSGKSLAGLTGLCSQRRLESLFMKSIYALGMTTEWMYAINAGDKKGHHV